MIQQLRTTANIRSFLDPRTGDVILQAADCQRFGFINDYCEAGFWEVIVRGSVVVDRRVDAIHINHKKQVVSTLRGYTEEAVDTLFEKRGEATLDGILRDYANAHIREPDKEQR